MSNKRDVVRFQVELSKPQMEDLEQLMSMVSITTKKELLNNALTVLKWAVREKAEGSSIVSINAKPDVPNRELSMPFLEGVIRSTGSPAPSPDSRRPTIGAKPVDPSTRFVNVAVKPVVAPERRPGAGDGEQLDEVTSSPFHAPSPFVTQSPAGQGQVASVTPFEKWLNEQKKAGASIDRSSANWREYVEYTKQTLGASDFTEDKVSMDQE